ncbi:PPOX class F420-dependent oxidoreductase [Streptomyces cinnabarinus]|uniref:PPOX class F420-dependent oxidoreductase n=1 Tax=Streptomyces cinnabarinus TaxID=67287 RepID=A0ABY7K3J9_9ACTN|nr:PPOX class F420-dependent oxidoreductase [Streptomyces cinnabarinus]WAZ19037.1 PPOX class F420-dependent oxidoreductase [Streptomyces cinnabarinus]
MPTTNSDFGQALDRIGQSKHISLTTYRKDGRAVRTPVGSLVHNGALYALTAPDTGKVKRIRNNPRVTVAPCAMNGTVEPGAPTATGTARLLDATGTAHVQELMEQRFCMY